MDVDAPEDESDREEKDEDEGAHNQIQAQRSVQRIYLPRAGLQVDSLSIVYCRCWSCDGRHWLNRGR